MLISVVTPSFRSSDWLKLCIASVADQGVPVEHIVQDAGSDDGTLDWLPQDHRIKAFIEKDAGMYDAINRGLRRAQGDVVAYLNCDEQYLPGALAEIGDYFQKHPSIDVLFCDFVAVDASGNYLFHRKVQTPLKYHTWVAHLATFSCATFFRRNILAEQGLYFDSKLRDAGDAEWMMRVIKSGRQLAVLRRFTSVFTITGANMGRGPNARKEASALAASAPALARRLRWLLILHHRLRRLFGGIYFQPAFTYSLYTRQSPGRRVLHNVRKPKFRWKTEA